MKKLMGLAALAGAATIAGASAAHAEGTVSANVSLTSNYMFRGLTQSDGDFAVQGGFDFEADMFYAGIWGSSIDDFGIDANTELDLYFGFTPTTGPINWDIGLVGYFYPGANTSIDFAELMVSGDFNPTEALTLGAAAFVSNDFLNTGADSLYLEANAAYAFTPAFAISGAFGNQDVDGSGDYDTWNIGGTYAIHGFELDLRYHDADLTGVDEELSFTISRNL